LLLLQDHILQLSYRWTKFLHVYSEQVNSMYTFPLSYKSLQQQNYANIITKPRVIISVSYW